jgi:hypothetical protein
MLGLLAIAESRKASVQATRVENLTILAFVFIPISTVSSIFGMNTYELVQNGPPMWKFAVAAVTVTVGAATAAWLFYLLRSRLPAPTSHTTRSNTNTPTQVFSIQTHKISQPFLSHPLSEDADTFTLDVLETVERPTTLFALNGRRRTHLTVPHVDEENSGADALTGQYSSSVDYPSARLSNGELLSRIPASEVTSATGCIVM